MRWLVAVLCVLFVLVAGDARAGFDEGLAAYNRGDYATALREFRPLAEHGDADAQFYLGFMYRRGVGVTLDYAEAVRWFRMAAEKGDANAQNSLGAMYGKGLGVPQDFAAALRWFRMAVEQGYATAQHNLGVAYREGNGVGQDYAKAVRWFRMAAEQGYADAQYNLGSMYRLGQGMTEDYAEAAKWFRLAAEQGHVDTQYNLGVMYRDGQGEPKDLVHSHMWFSLAANQGDYEAARNRDLVARRMTPEQISEAQRLAREWEPKQQSAATTSKPKAEVSTTNREHIARVQRGLASLGYDPGPTDGKLGPRTRAAIREFQAREGLPVTGTPSAGLEAALRSAMAGHVAAVVPSDPRTMEMSSTGSGFYVTKQGHILTNEHVVNGCSEVRIPPSLPVEIVARDEASDLALLRRSSGKVGAPVKFRGGRGIRPGDDIVVLGYPLHGLLASEANVTSGTVSALAGPGDDRRLFQITAPVQLGNSGGPVLDLAGNAVGVIMSKLDAVRFAEVTGDIPQNVNFAIASGTARTFLDVYDIPYETAPSTAKLETADVAAMARAFTVLVECWN